VHLVVDAVAVQEGSAAIVVGHLLSGWRLTAPGDRVTVVTGPAGAAFELPMSYEELRLQPPVGGAAGEMWLRSVGIRRAVRALGADAVLSGVPASGLLPTGARRGIILYDLRHELRPDQFSLAKRASRYTSWAWSMRRADAIFCISERTRADLEQLHPKSARRAVATPLGSDHVDEWERRGPEEQPYALAFGHFSNKNVDKVLAAWAEFCRADERWKLRLVGMGRADRDEATAAVAALGISGRVELMPWLEDHAFVECFTGAGLVVYPSDFEGFGLPAVEAMRLGIPLVVSSDAALLEVTGGHAEVVTELGPEALADAMRRASMRTSEELAAAAAYTDRFSWTGMAVTVRDWLARS
jgi:glycosyltransferase involved in cell wall biosynthesis